MSNEQAQRKIIAAAFFPATSLTTVPSAYEQRLTDQYIAGHLTVRQSVELLEAYHRHVGSGCPPRVPSLLPLERSR